MDNIDHSNFKRRVIYNKIPSKKMTAAYDYRVLPDFLLNVKFIYSEKATKFCEISNLLLTTVHAVKSKVEILKNFVAFSEHMNFKMRYLIAQNTKIRVSGNQGACMNSNDSSEKLYPHCGLAPS